MAKTLYELYLENMKKAGTQKASQPAALPAIKMPTLEAPKTTPTARAATGGRVPTVGAKKTSGVDIVKAVTQKPTAQGGGRVTMPQVKKQETATDRLANIRAFGAGDYSGGGELLKKIGQTVASGVLGSAAGITEIAGQATPTTGEQHLGQFSGFGDIGRAVRESRETGEDINTITQRLEQERSQRRKADRQKTYAAADKLTERSAQLQQEAKEGTGKVGGFLVDLGVTGTQMAGDALANVLLPGSGLAAMGTRVYGQSAGDARREGKTEGQQVLSGLKGATIEVLTEKLFGGLAKAYGAGTADVLVEKMADKLTRTDAGKRVATWLINSGGEGIEEVVSDLLNPLADRALRLDDGKSPIYTTDDVAQMGYDFLLGTAMGAIGGAGQLRGTQSTPAAQETRPVQMPTLVDANGRTAAQRQAAETFNSETKSDAVGVLSLLRSNIKTLHEMQPVTHVTGSELEQSGKATDRVYNFFRSIGGKVRREGFGDVLFSKSRVRNSLVGHGTGEAKIQLAAAVPSVIEHGAEINYTPNWKGRGYDSYVFAAPVDYNGAETYVVAIVTRDNANRYYLHEALDGEGNLIYKKPEGSNAASDSPTAEPQNTIADIEPSIDTTIPQGQEGVNTQGMQNGGEYAANRLRMPMLVDANGRTAEGVVDPYAYAYDERVPALESIEKEEPSSSATANTEQSPPLSHPSSSSTIRVQDLLHLVNSEYQKYVPDEKRAAPLLRPTGLTIASQQLLQNGSVGNISYAGQDVNIEGTPFSDMTRQEQFSAGRGLEEMQRDGEYAPVQRAVRVESPTDNFSAAHEAVDNGLRSPRLTTYEQRRTRAGAETGTSVVRNRVRNMDAMTDAAAERARERQTQQEEAGRQIPETLRRLGVEPYGSEADYAGAETLAREAKNSNSARKSIQKQIGKMEASEKERLFARQLAEGKLTLRDIPGTLDAERLLKLADLYRAMDSDPATALLSRRRETILERETAKMEPLLGMDVTYDEGGMTDTGKRSGRIAKRFGTLRRNLQTPARVCETEWGAAHGREVYDTLFRPVTENNGRQITWVNSMLDKVRTFKDSSGNVRELNRAERALVQRLVEHQAAEGRVMKLDRQYAPAAENVRNGQAAEDAAREFGIDRSTQEYEDLLNYQAYISATEDLKNSKEADATAVQAAVQAYSGIYKELYEGINTFLVAHGYQPIGFIEGYAPHLQPEAEKTAFTKALKLLGLDDVAMELPTSISGKTAELKPYKQYNPFFQKRRGDKTEYDIAKGYEDYVYYLGNIFYHTDDIMRIRAAERYIRKTYSSEEAGEMISQAEAARDFSDAGIEEFLRLSGVVGKDTQLGEGDARNLLGDYIGKLYDQVGNVTRYNEMAKYLDNYANRLAGKQSYVDRGAEAATGRGSLNWINALSGKYGGAKLAFNFSSAINQTSQLPMVAVENGEINTARAMRDFFGKDRVNFVKESNFLNGKRGVKWLLGAETGWDKFKQYGFTMTEAVDSFTAYTAVRSKYLKELKAGKSHAEALALADEYGRRVMGSRARGEKPVLFDTKNPFWQIVTRFQLETLNSWEHVRRDLPNEYRTMASEKGKAYAAGVMGGRAARYVLYAFLANLGVGMLSGGSPVPYDVVGNTVEALGKAWGLTKSTAVATILDNVLQAVFDERLFGTPEPDDEDNADWWAALESLFGNVANDVPVVSRAAALAGIGDQTLAAADLSKAWDVVKDVKSNGFSTDTLDKALTAGGEFLYGGNQLRKTVQGTMDVARGGRYSKGKLRYQVEQTPWNFIKGALFGRSSLDEAQDYYAEKSSDFSAKQTETFGTMQDAGVTAKESYDLIQKLRGIEKTDDESRAELQRRALMASTVSGEGKAAAYYGLLASDTEKDAMDAVDAADPDTDMGEVTRLLVQFKSCKNDTQKLEALESSTLTLRQKAEMYNNLIASEETLLKQSELKAFDGITAENYYLYKAATLGLTVKAAKLLAIDSLNLTAAQKDAIYYSEGWAESKLHEAPWHGGQTAAVRMPVVKTTGGAPVFVRVAQSAPTVQMPVVRTTAKAPVYVRVKQDVPEAVRVVKMPVVK